MIYSIDSIQQCLLVHLAYHKESCALVDAMSSDASRGTYLIQANFSYTVVKLLPTYFPHKLHLFSSRALLFVLLTTNLHPVSIFPIFEILLQPVGSGVAQSGEQLHECLIVRPVKAPQVLLGLRHHWSVVASFSLS